MTPFKKHSILFLTLILSTCFVFSQENDESQKKTKSDFWNNVRFGGGLGLDFGDRFFSATVAPSAIYQFDAKVALGVGLNGTLNNRKDIYKSTILGGSIIGLYNVLSYIQLSTEFEQLNVNRRYASSLNLRNDNYWSPALFLGAGYRSNNVTFGIRYDVLYDDGRSIYAQAWAPFVRFYF